jgi:hypothetical protein
MTKPIGAQLRQELVNALRERYRVSTQKEKARILEEFVAVSGYHRKYAIGVLNAEAEPENRPCRRIRPRIYDGAVLEGLRKIWAILDFICGKRLKPILPEVIAVLEKHHEIVLDAAKGDGGKIRKHQHCTQCYTPNSHGDPSHRMPDHGGQRGLPIS